jgi:hypothetical protein
MTTMENNVTVIETAATDEKKAISFKETYEKNFAKLIVKQNPITSKEEVKSLLSLYYQIQDFRIGAGNRQFQLDSQEDDDNADAKSKASKNISFVYTNAGLKDIEDTIATWLTDYVKRDPIGKWLLEVKGIGGVLAAGFLAYIDISKCQTAGAIWRYAGIEGHKAPRKKGVKIDYNPNFKVLCWKAGEQFVKVSGYAKDPKTKEVLLDENGDPVYRIKDALYGHLYREKLAELVAKNEAGGFKDFAALILTEKNFTKETDTKKTYEEGKLPMAHLMAMAKRYAVKIFLSHLFTLWYEHANGKPAPRPFAEVHLGHVHIIEPPKKEILGL